jgi:damage-control phosphatase, subfamily III
MQARLPTILGKAIDDTTRTLNEQSDEEKIVDLVQCIERMEQLMHDLSGNQKLRPIIDDNEADVALWNKEIAKYFQGKSLFQYCYIALTSFEGRIL